MLQLNELVADSGKTKIKAGQVQAVSQSWEPGFQSTFSPREGEQEKNLPVYAKDISRALIL